MIDLHSHILPGIDDGPNQLVESIKIAALMRTLGYTHIFATPHYRRHLYENDHKKVSSEVKLFNSNLNQQSIPITVLPGNEVHFDSMLNDQLKAEPFHTLGMINNWVLVELPYGDISFDFVVKGLDCLSQEGYSILLAHPERSPLLKNDKQLIETLYKKGVRYQINLPSLIGQYGQRSFETANYIIGAEMVFGFGSDVHSYLQAKETLPKSISYLKSKLPETSLDKIHDNITQIFDLN